MAQLRNRSRGVAALSAVLVFAACGGGDSSDTISPPETEETIATASTVSGDIDAPDAPLLIDTVTFLEIDLPAGMLFFDTNNQRVSFRGVAYVVTLQADGIRLISIDADGARQTDAAITGAIFGEVWNSGTKVVLTGIGESSDLMILSSGDGTTFTETRIPVPSRYADQDVWEATTLAADVGGVADLDGDLYMIARMGIDWTRVNDLVALSAYAISDELGDSAVRASVVTRSPEDDGDALFTFKVDGEVVYEVLGSEAGLEPGYEEAYEALIRDAEMDVSFHGAWIVSGGEATEDDAPFDGGLDADLGLNQLYSVDRGVAALVTDWSPGALAPSQFVGRGGLLSGGFVARRQSTRLYDIWWKESAPGRWIPVDDSVGVAQGEPPEIWRNSRGVFFMGQPRVGADEQLDVRSSEDGLMWPEESPVVTITIPGGGTASFARVSGELFMIRTSLDPEADATIFKVTLNEGGDGELRDASVDEIDATTGEPVEWDDNDPILFEEEALPKRTRTWESLGILPIELFFNGVLFQTIEESVFTADYFLDHSRQ